jgi:hypothetical protein
LPERIIRTAERSFTATATGSRAAYRGANHLMMVVFEETESEMSP